MKTLLECETREGRSRSGSRQGLTSGLATPNSLRKLKQKDKAAMAFKVRKSNDYFNENVNTQS